MLIPPHAGGPFTLRFSMRLVKWILYSILFFCLLFVASIFVAFDTNVQLAHYKILKKKSDIRAIKLASQQDRIQMLQNDIDSMMEKQHQILFLLGETNPQNSPNSDKKKTITNANPSVSETDLRSQSLEAIPSMNAQISYLESEAIRAQKRLKSLHSLARQYKKRFDHTPSIRPVFARIGSGYGTRFHPIYRHNRFHKGLDFATWTGAPIQATADGLVEFAGWHHTYGYVVLLNHGYGYRTLYAHCSHLLTSRGKTVKKGQVIAQVGSTGSSTGSHLHYEVRKFKEPVNPALYISLNLRTARQRFW